MPGFNLEPAIREMVSANIEVVARLADALPNMAIYDAATGSVQIDRTELENVLQTVLPQQLASPLAFNITASTSSGMAVFGTEPEAPAMPWLILEDMIYTLQGLPAPIRTDLGLGFLSGGPTLSFPRRPFTGPLVPPTPEAVRSTVLSRFPNLPEDIFAGGRIELLLRDPPLLAAGGPAIPDIPEPDPDTRPERPSSPGTATVGGADLTGTVSPVVPLSPEQAREAAICFLSGNWSGWFEGPLGWIPGWKVCLSQDCADRLANILMGFGGGKALYDAIQAALSAGVAAAIKAVAVSAAIVLSVIGFLLGVNIKLVNGPNGVCIYANWPYTGGFVFWADSA